MHEFSVKIHAKFDKPFLSTKKYMLRIYCKEEL